MIAGPYDSGTYMEFEGCAAKYQASTRQTLRADAAIEAVHTPKKLGKQVWHVSVPSHLACKLKFPLNFPQHRSDVTADCTAQPHDMHLTPHNEFLGNIP